MIVDDQLGIRLLLEEIIKSEGYESATAENGKQALDMIKEKVPDLLLLDYKLPIMDGPEVLKNLEQQGLEIPAIIMSGLAEEAIAEKRNFAMVKEIFAKPFNIEKAKQCIVEILEND